MKYKKYIVLMAALVFNIVNGVLYIWSLIKYKLVSDLDWSTTESILPYTMAIACFAVFALVGGKIQDKIGPQKVITAGGIFVGVGLILSGLFIDSPFIVSIFFGLIVGCGIGLGYACVVPTSLKWFSPNQKGLISGLVVSAVGLGAFLYSPVVQKLLVSFGVSKTFIALGTFILIISFICSRFIVLPNDDYIPSEKLDKDGNSMTVVKVADYDWKYMLKTKQFYLIFFVYALGASVGLMIIGSMAEIYLTHVPQNALLSVATVVAIVSAFNAIGKLCSGAMSDKIGRVNTLIITVVLQTISMILFPYTSTTFQVILLGSTVGYSYGAYLSVIPAYIADNYGLKNLGTNYGVVYLAWGVAGILAPIVGSKIGLLNSYKMGVLLSFIVLILIIVLKRLQKVKNA